MKCSGPTQIVLASFPTTLTIDDVRSQVWSTLRQQFSQSPYKLEFADTNQTDLVVRYKGSARPYIECGRAGSVAGKVEMRSIDKSPGKLETRLVVKLEDAEMGKTKVHLSTHHVLTHKDKALTHPIEIQDRGVAPLKEGWVCWSTGALENSVFTRSHNKVAKQPLDQLTKSESETVVVTDPNGITIYYYDRDERNKSTCNGRCAEFWFPVRPAPKFEGQPNFATIKRADGSKQLAFQGWPLYTFHRDKKPGDAKGDGQQGVWHVLKF